MQLERSKNRGPARRMWSLILVTLLIVAACGGSGADEGPSRSDAGSAEVAETTQSAGQETTVTTTSPPSSTVTPTASGDEGEDDGSSIAAGGHATVAIADVTMQFESFVCYEGAAAVEAFGNDDLTFAALGQAAHDGGLASVVVTSIDSPFGTNYTVFFGPSEHAEIHWQMVGVDAATIDGARITAEGAFSRIVDGTLTADTDLGTLDAMCG